MFDAAFEPMITAKSPIRRKRHNSGEFEHSLPESILAELEGFKDKHLR